MLLKDMVINTKKKKKEYVKEFESDGEGEGEEQDRELGTAICFNVAELVDFSN